MTITLSMDFSKNICLGTRRNGSIDHCRQNCTCNCTTFICSYSSIELASLVPKSFEEEEKGPGTHRLHMLCYPKNHEGLDTTVNYSASLICIHIPLRNNIIIITLAFRTIICKCEQPADDRILTPLRLSVFLSTCTMRIYVV